MHHRGWTEFTLTELVVVMGVAAGLSALLPGRAQRLLRPRDRHQMYARAVSGMWFGVRLVGVGPESGRHTCSSSLEADMTLDGCTGTDW
jgi:hypothetical protein